MDINEFAGFLEQEVKRRNFLLPFRLQQSNPDFFSNLADNALYHVPSYDEAAERMLTMNDIDFIKIFVGIVILAYPVGEDQIVFIKHLKSIVKQLEELVPGHPRFACAELANRMLTDLQEKGMDIYNTDTIYLTDDPKKAEALAESMRSTLN